MHFDFNQSNNFDSIEQQYQLDKRVRIDQVLASSQAEALWDTVSKLQYTHTFFQNGINESITRQQLQDMSPQNRQTFFKSLYTEAAKGVGFFYGRHPLSSSAKEDENLLSKVFDWLNAADTLEKIKTITGFDDITTASAQATQYVPGHYLTRHNDVNPQEKRRVAYVLGLSKHWHPDWGGLLQFYQADGTPKDAWAPKFNSLALFDVNHVHGVSYVAPYATQARYSITGWFRAD
jgi:SM-20-related protein